MTDCNYIQAVDHVLMTIFFENEIYNILKVKCLGNEELLIFFQGLENDINHEGDDKSP